MVIDIDTFLDKFDEVDKKKSSKDSGFKDESKEDENKIDIDFQKDVEDKLYSVSNKGLNTPDYDFLKKIYDEVKRFDEDIPTKFLGISGEGNVALKLLGDKYSKVFLEKVEGNILLITKASDQKFIELDKLLLENKYVDIITSYTELIKFYNLFPREFIRKKIELGKKLRIREIVINEKLKKYKSGKLIEIRKSLKKNIVKLNSLLKPGYGREIEDQISFLHYLVNSISKLFMSDLSNERILISKILMKAEHYLENEYTREFNLKKKIMHNLFEKYHAHLIEKNLNETLITYDEILLQFKSLPDVFLEEKILIYNQVNELYSSVNNLIVGNSVSTFLRSYNYSKIFEEVRDYLRIVSVTKQINPSNLKALKLKLKSVPDNSNPDKIELSRNLDYLISIYKKKELERIKKKKKIKELKRDEKNKPDTDKFKKTETIHIDEKYLQNKNMNKNVMEQINLYYEKLKISNNYKELKILYGKIIFYLNLTPLDDKAKKSLIFKVNKVLSKKKLSKK